MSVYARIGSVFEAVVGVLYYAFLWPLFVTVEPTSSVDEDTGRAVVGVVGTLVWWVVLVVGLRAVSMG